MEPIVHELRRHFDRVVVIGLHRIPAFYKALDSHPETGEVVDAIRCFHAIDASKCKPPPYWKDIPALWGCGESHRQVIARALSDGVHRLFIMEDDCRFVSDAAEQVAKFMPEVPADFDGIMLGGQVSVYDGQTTSITPRVSKCVQVERLHAYGLSRAGMQKFHDILCEPTSVANDYRWGDAQQNGSLNVYRIEPFVAYQCAGPSAISGSVEANRAWDDRVDVRIRKAEDVPVVCLVCPFAVMERLRREGIISNGGQSPPQMATLEAGRVEHGEQQVAEMMLDTCHNDPERAARAVARLRSDAAFHPDGPLALWHPSEFIPFDAPKIRAATFDEARAKLAGISRE